ncbi:hypothetical protein ACOSP7_018328 [Xanthoceras sorbifolium]
MLPLAVSLPKILFCGFSKQVRIYFLYARGVLAGSAARGGVVGSRTVGLVASSSVSRGLFAADFGGSIAGGELIVPAILFGGLSYAESRVGKLTAGSFLVGSLIVPSGLSFGVRMRASPTAIRSLGVLGAGGRVFDVADCDGRLCVGEGMVLVTAAGGAIPDPGNDRAAGVVLLGPVDCFLVGFVVVSGRLRVEGRRVVRPAAGSGLGDASSRRGVLGATGGGGGESAFSACSSVLSSAAKHY